MVPEIRQAAHIGFCMGVRRAVDTVTQVAQQHGGVETLGALVHNQQVLGKLSGCGVRIIDSAAEIQGDTVVISAHGVGPQVTAELEARGLNVIDTTCAFVRRAQVAARRLSSAGFYTIVYGDGEHPEVRGILGWADGKGMATLDAAALRNIQDMPRKLGLLSQTTQIPQAFAAFVKEVVDIALVKDAEIHVIDTLCHDIRRRQTDTLEMADGSDIVFVIGGRNSANTKHLLELCATVAHVYQIETASDIDPLWLCGKKKIGVTAGASTDDATIDDVMLRLRALTDV
ncbi:MAG: 4-hydroxy-3-methylbut-2-enyl diphosphate reductase [Dehalococcoidia bacterium]|nr:4-hydroxy-3-methylbut-2-enyl diphosphate reductase [Dehalococcoidia bacterium]